jgi:type II secretory pathway pseudopilin PulG
MRKNEKGFSAVEALIVLVIVGLIGCVGWYVWQSQNNNEKTNSSLKTNNTQSNSEQAKGQNTGLLVMKEWGLQFKIPNSLTDVQYRIDGDTAAFFAKPSDANVDYRSDYDKFENEHYTFALGLLYRSKEATQERPVRTVAGKKLGNYYYYTSHSFNGLATSAAPNGLYLDAYCEQNLRDTEPKCVQLIKAETKAFHILNGTEGDGTVGLLPTIELAK